MRDTNDDGGACVSREKYCTDYGVIPLHLYVTMQPGTFDCALAAIKVPSSRTAATCTAPGQPQCAQNLQFN